MDSFVTTGHGDKGQTSTLGGDSLSKSDPLIETVGMVDELRVWMSIVRNQLLDSDIENRQEFTGFLEWLAHLNLVIGAACSDPYQKKKEMIQHPLTEEHLKKLECFQAHIEKELNIPKAFILFASNNISAHIDLLCSLTRKLERRVVSLKEAIPEFDAALLITFLNRLSDVFYVWARHVENKTHFTADYDNLDSLLPK